MSGSGSQGGLEAAKRVSSLTPPMVIRALAKQGIGRAVEVEVGEHVVRSDLPVSRGGTDSAASPGHLMRAAVAACLLMSYKACAAELGIPIEEIEIDLTTEHQANSDNGTGYRSGGWRRIRWNVRLTSTASDGEIALMLVRAERQSPMLATVDSSCERVRTFQVRRPSARPTR